MRIPITPRHAIVLLVLAATAPQLHAQRLYSTASDAVFRFDAADDSCTPLADLLTPNLASPIGALLHLGNGVLIGVADNSPSIYGAIYRTDTTTNVVTILHQFSNVTKSVTGFVQGDNGLLYTLGVSGASGSTCALYAFDPATNAYTEVHVVPGISNAMPLARLMKATNGLLYGVTEHGGTNDAGTLFSYNTGTSTFTTLYNFGAANGTEPLAGLLQATNGKLYGTTSYGGANDKGVLFSFDPATAQYAKLYDFVQANGENPNAPLMQAANGLLYSTTMTGGASFQGTLYSFDPATNAYTLLHSFFAGEGYGPRAQPIQAGNGLLYGGTNQGGANFNGTIYSYDIGNNLFTKLYDGDDATTGNFVCPFLSFETAEVGVAENAAAPKQVLAFPNPTADQLRLDEACPNCTYVALDQRGRTVANGVVLDRSISLAALPAGAYTLHITSPRTAPLQVQVVKE